MPTATLSSRLTNYHQLLMTLNRYLVITLNHPSPPPVSVMCNTPTRVFRLIFNVYNPPHSPKPFTTFFDHKSKVKFVGGPLALYYTVLYSIDQQPCGRDCLPTLRLRQPRPWLPAENSKFLLLTPTLNQVCNPPPTHTQPSKPFTSQLSSASKTVLHATILGITTHIQDISRISHDIVYQQTLASGTNPTRNRLAIEHPMFLMSVYTRGLEWVGPGVVTQMFRQRSVARPELSPKVRYPPDVLERKVMSCFTDFSERLPLDVAIL